MRFTEDTTRYGDLRKLVAAGWDLRQLEAREKPTTYGIILGEAAHKLAVEANRIQVGS